MTGTFGDLTQNALRDLSYHFNPKSLPKIMRNAGLRTFSLLKWDIGARSFSSFSFGTSHLPSGPGRGIGSSVTQSKVTNVVWSLLSGRALGVDEIRPESLRSLDVAGLYWLTCLCNIAW